MNSSTDSDTKIKLNKFLVMLRFFGHIIIIIYNPNPEKMESVHVLIPLNNNRIDSFERVP